MEHNSVEGAFRRLDQKTARVTKTLKENCDDGGKLSFYHALDSDLRAA
jgi:hypothetical protein